MYLGFFNNEDFVSGTIDDYKIHLAAADLMRVDIVGSILRYDSLKVKEGVIPHSPIYILYFTYLISHAISHMLHFACHIL